MSKHNKIQSFKNDEIPSQEISDPYVFLKNPLIINKLIF